ncbi:hypothetical protein SteCoe_10053 [Stentor coeruleus]|uniref:Nudix hydrolase domain-containing protein n=1 Tax=Stentor coeruleus TaxID=5963 RepID=A0A1R2CGJ5_9CILI|nr:hypothetical protein SteCoe_10053 [Stentor coeruleus]
MSKPKLSASLIICRERPNHPWEILMIKRKSNITFSNAMVFPGGSLDNEDTYPEWHNIIGCSTDTIPSTSFSEKIDLTSLRIAAIRETWEEIGVLLSKTKSKPPASNSLLETCKTYNIIPSIEKLHFLTRIIAPAYVGKRFDTTFFISIEGEQEIILDNIEADNYIWGTPDYFINEYMANRMIIWVPQLFILKKISAFRNLSEVFHGASFFNKIPNLFQTKDYYDKKFLFYLPGDYRHDLTSLDIKEKKYVNSFELDGQNMTIIESPELLDYFP